MKKIITLFLLLPLFTSCSKKDNNVIEEVLYPYIWVHNDTITYDGANMTTYTHQTLNFSKSGFLLKKEDLNLYEEGATEEKTSIIEGDYIYNYPSLVLNSYSFNIEGIIKDDHLSFNTSNIQKKIFKRE